MPPAVWVGQIVMPAAARVAATKEITTKVVAWASIVAPQQPVRSCPSMTPHRTRLGVPLIWPPR